MEETILKTIKYNLTVPTAHHFLIRFLKAAHADNAMISLSCYILDGTLLTYEDLQCRYLPSMLAAAVVMIARRTIRRHDWSPTLLHMSEYRQEDVEPVAIAIMKAKERRAITTPTLATLEKKYSKVKYQHVAEMALPKFG
jgi:G2/mitotic-specific cyclin-B, other